MAVDGSVLWSAYRLAAGVVGAPEVRAAWDRVSAVAGYTVGGLVAHLVTATSRTADVLEAAEPDIAATRTVGIAEFYGVNRIESDDDRTDGLHAFLVADAGAKAGAGPDATVAAFLAIEGRLRPLLDSDEVDADRLVPVVQVRGGAARLEDYLLTRAVELVVHADDIAVSAGVPDLELPDDVARPLAHLFADLALARSGGLAVVRAFTRRERADGDVLRVL